MNLSTPGHIMHNQAAPQESPTKSFHCSHCPLIFKSKIFLFEHLNNVHGISVGTALRDAGLSGINNDNSGSSRGTFECQEFFKTHETCDKKSEDQNMKGNLIISENPATTISVISANPHKKAARSKEISSEVMSTSKSKCTQNLSRDLKTYKRPLQTITKYFKPPSGSNGKPPVKSTDNPVPLDCASGTLILQESPSISSPNSSGVFKVTAKSMIDLSKVSQLQARILIDDLTPPKPEGQINGPIPNNAGKRTCKESLTSPLTKKMKMDKEEAKASVQKAEFSFEVSEDEEEKRINLVNGDVKSPQVYLCKHCDYSDVGIQNVSTHYENDHPYVRYTSDYIQNPSDQSATFRCLECPVEFLSVVDLKKHYTENHPEAPNVFTMQLRELRLVFKCFVCPFTIHTLKALKGHYKEKHPTHAVNNSLMYCRYLAARTQEGSSRLNTCEKTPSSERISTESGTIPCEEVKKSFQHATSKGVGVTLFQCNNCKFSHKSVVVMHVHYQKSHPEEAVTIDKIKQLACVTSQTTQRKTSVTIVDKSTPRKISDSQIPKTKDKAKMSEQKISFSLTNPKHTPETSKTHSESPKTKKVESSDDGTPAKCDRKMSTQMGGLSPTSPNTVFYCQLCSYSSINIRSVVCHHNSKHSMHALIGIQEILKYSVEFQKKKCQSEAEASASTSSSTSVREQHAYARAEDLFYCQKCNFGNPTVKGVMVHQSQTHADLKISNECIMKHSAMIHDEIEKSKSQAKESSFPSDLPLPLLNEGDEHMFFCHLCNYRQRTVSHVVKHFFKRHRGFKVKEEQIHQYTSMVLEKTQKLCLKATSNQEVNQASVGKKGKKLKKTKKLSTSSSKKATQTQKVFQCQRCTFKSQDVYLLRKHIRKFHRSHSSVSNVLNVSVKQGKLQSGYCCELCVFTHKKATTLYKHYQEKHPEHRQSLKFITTRLYVGPGTSPPKKKKPQIKHTDGISDCDGTNESLPSQRSGQNETKIYRCRACSFKGHSVSSITHHYRAVHPWSVKEDGSVLDVINRKKPSANKQLEDVSEVPGSFDTYQAPLEFEKSPDSSDEATVSVTMLKCPHCPVKFYTKHGLNTHCGMKHIQYAIEKLEKQQVQVQTGVHAFKCPHCTYVNNNHQGVLTHCQMRHPTLASRAESLHVDDAHLHDWDGCLKRKGAGGKLRFSGYMCNTCPQIHATPEKLNKHCEEDHNQTGPITVPSVPKPAPKPPAGSKTQQSKTHNTLRSVSKGSSFNKNTYAVVRCRQCDYRCATKTALSRHMLANHKNAPISQCVYMCVICSKTYFRKKRLGNHYTEKHGKDAYLKYYAPVYENVPKKPPPTSPDFASIQAAENTSEACQSSTATERNKKRIFKCPSCPYVNASHHGTLTHCQMKHPAVMARTDKLETDEILVANMVTCTIGKGSNERGYMCKICSQIHASLKKLKVHVERDHDQASEHSTEIETKKQSLSMDHDSQGTVLEAASSKHKDSAVSTTEIGLSHQLGIRQKSATKTVDHDLMYRCPLCSYSSSIQRHLASHYSQKHAKKASRKYYAKVYHQKCKKPQPPSSVQKKYKCDVCSYNGVQRRYLWRHYKEYHSFDSLTTCKKLLKYNKPRNTVSKLPESEESAQIKCKKCPNLFFDSFEVLIIHYSTFHSSDCKLDFTVLYPPSKSSTGVYRCCHCKKQLNGIRKLHLHLDQHRERNENKKNAARTKASHVFTITPEAKSTELCVRDELPTFESVEELAQRNVTQVETFTLPTSPLSSPSKPADVQQRKKLDNLPPSALKHNINKYVLFKPGTLRPFQCIICHYRTTVMALWKRHFMKHHQDVIMDPAETDNHDKENSQVPEKELSNSSEELNNLSEPDEEPEITEKSLYLEPPDVQRQLNHYSLMTEAGASSKVNVQEPKLPENGLLHCEFCNFTSEHLSSIRRHLLNRHGKKIHRCKDCNFFTGCRKTLDMHIETGHSTYQSEPTHQKDLRCPFCLYQTKNKNNMIDHIILHREERVVPIEVRRPQLSRYLQGIVFRCHKCTFTSASPENLRLHMTKHDDIKPYKCRLCYFDCTQLCDLEAHLCDKHQVVRNHALVGQVSLDQQEARLGRMPEEEEEEEEPLSNLEHHNNESEDIEAEEFVTDCNEVPYETRARNPAVNGMRENIRLQTEEPYLLHCSRKENEESLTKSSASATVPEKHGQDPQEQAQNEMFLTDAAKRPKVENMVEPNVAEENNADMCFQDGNDPEKETQKNENQPKLRDRRLMLIQQREAAAEAQAHKLQIKAQLNFEARVENDILRHILVLDEEGSFSKIHRKAVHDSTVIENIENEVVDNVLNQVILRNEQRSITSAQPKHLPEVRTEVTPDVAKKNLMLENNIRSQECFTAERDLLTLTPLKIRQNKQEDEESLGASLTNFKEEQVHNQISCEELTDPYGAMPVLENECLKDKPFVCCKEEEDDQFEQKHDRGDEVTESIESRCKEEEHEEGEADKPHVPKGAVTAMDGAAEVRHSPITEKKLFTCELCGRNLMNSSELERHVIRHGI